MKPMATLNEPWRNPAPIIYTEIRMPLPEGPYFVSYGAFNPAFEYLKPFLTGPPIRRPSRRAKPPIRPTPRKKKT